MTIHLDAQHIVTWLALGLVAGLLAKTIMPVNIPGGWLMTIGLGIAGALVGGILGGLLGLGTVSGFNLGSVVLSVLGGILVLFIYGKMKR